MHKHLYRPHVFNRSSSLISVQFVFKFEATSHLKRLPMYPDTDFDIDHSLMLVGFYFPADLCFFFRM